jgi:ATP-dependent DNA helicase DinG
MPDAPSKTQAGQNEQKQPMSELRACSMVEFFGGQGPLAQMLPDYELRPSQQEMAEAVKTALLNERHALIEAPTGTGKSIAYLIPAILSGKTVVVATANKSLQSQLYLKDIPFLRKVLKREINAVLVKGRSNFICTYKWEAELFEQQRIKLYDREHPQIQPVRQWLGSTDSGDIDDLPFMLDSDLRPRIVSFPDDCLHGDCPFYDDQCWVNHMRDKASQAQVLITNHHLLLNALELGAAGERLLPSAAIYVIDEAHGLEQTATTVYETIVTDYTVEQLLSRSLFKQEEFQTAVIDEDELEDIRFQNTLAFQEISQLSRENAFRIEVELEETKKLSRALSDLAKQMKERNPYAESVPLDSDNQEIGSVKKLPKKVKTSGKTSVKTLGKLSGKADNKAPIDDATQRKIYELAIEGLNSAAGKLMTIATSKRDAESVRYAQRVFERRSITLEVHSAPINPAALLKEYLFHPVENDQPLERSVICTSATLATDKQFGHFKLRCGIESNCEEHVLPPVFNYPKQTLLYQPALPAFDYRNTDAFYSAATQEIARLLEVSRGRALCLFTSWGGLQQIRDALSGVDKQPIWPLRAQGDAPRDTLLAWFKSTPNSVLLATRSFWEGVDIPGDDLSLVIVDKMPFPTPNDPLHSARMKAIDDAGRSSFAEYMTPLMTLALKQGFGRLIRRASDRGVVAILDERLTSKSYGRQTRNDLPPARFSRDFRDVNRFFQETLAMPSDFALNVWCVEAPPERLAVLTLDSDDPANNSAGVQRKLVWRWQLVRLLDGKSDGQQGTAMDLPDRQTGEIFATVAGLRNLRQRIEGAGRVTNDFSVELRCSTVAADLLTVDDQAPSAWRDEKTRWKTISLCPLPATP